MDLLREKLRARGNHRAQVAAAMIGSAVVGGVLSSSAAKSAANTQADAANRATDSQNAMFDKTVGLEAPFRQSGVDAQTKLNNLLGIGSTGGAPSGPAASFGGLPASAIGTGAESADAIRARLAGQFTTQGQGGGMVMDANQNQVWIPGPSSVDHAGLDAAVQAELAKQQTSQQAHGQGAPGGSQADPSYGSLLKPFGMEDFQLDPGIKFQMEQGNQALMNSQAAQNGSLSGAALKSLIGFNQQMAGTGYQSAFDRYMANKSFTLGSLMDQEKVGQAAAGNTVNAAPAFSSGIASTIQGAGNASAAGTMGAANALSGAASGASNGFLLRNLLNGGGGSTASSLGANSPLDSGLIFSNGSLGD